VQQAFLLLVSARSNAGFLFWDIAVIAIQLLLIFGLLW
jgi:hypothetical protein